MGSGYIPAFSIPRDTLTAEGMCSTSYRLSDDSQAAAGAEMPKPLLPLTPSWAVRPGGGGAPRLAAGLRAPARKAGRLMSRIKCPAILPVPDVRRTVPGGCGAAAAQSVCEYFGVGLPSGLQTDYAAALGTTAEAGTPPAALVAFFRARGLSVAEASGMTLADLAAHAGAGRLVVCPIQDYGDPGDDANEEAGHYVIVLAVVDGSLIVQDSSADNLYEGSGTDAAPGRVLIAGEDFVRVWHDRDAGGGRYVHYGVVVAAPPPGAKGLSSRLGKTVKVARPALKSAAPPPDDPADMADALADVLGGLLGEDAFLIFQDDAGDRQKAWNPDDHPRGKNGQFIRRGSDEAVAAAKKQIAALKGKKPTAKNATELMKHLGILTVRQLREVAKEHGLKCPEKIRAELVGKIKEKLQGSETHGGGKPEPKKVKPKPSGKLESKLGDKQPEAAPQKVAPGEHDLPGTRLKLSVAHEVSHEFVGKVKEALGKVPAKVLDRYAANGGKVKVGETVVKMLPHLDGQHPRNWRGGATWKSADGVYDDVNGAAISAESHKVIGSDQMVKSARPAGVMLHELGHGVDEKLGGNVHLSRTPEFVEAYKLDARAVRAAGKDRQYSYYLQPGDAGRQEAFAETFAQMHGHGAAYWDDKFLDHWPNVRKVIEAKLGGVT